jgi:hypothetical protein
MGYFHVTGRYRQEIHAHIEAETAEEAAVKCQERFQAWLDGGMEDMEGIWFGPEEAELDENVLLTQAKATREDPTYWTETEEVELTTVAGAWKVSA